MKWRPVWFAEFENGTFDVSPTICTSSSTFPHDSLLLSTKGSTKTTAGWCFFSQKSSNPKKKKSPTSSLFSLSLSLSRSPSVAFCAGNGGEV
jgi:hypothetical protein